MNEPAIISKIVSTFNTLKNDGKCTNDEVEQIKEVLFSLQNHKALLTTFLNNIPDAVYFKDTKSRFIKVSQSMMKRFNLRDASQIIGKTDFDIQNPIHATEAFDDEQEIVRTGTPIINKIEKEYHSYGERWVSTTKIPMREESGQIYGILGISRDITDFVKTKQEIQLKNEELKAVEEELRQTIEELRAAQEKVQNQQHLLEQNNQENDS